MEFVIAGVLLVVAVGLIGCILGGLKNTEERKYYDAAARILKENSLDKIISGHGKKYTERKKNDGLFENFGTKWTGLCIRNGKRHSYWQVCRRKRSVYP